MPSLTTLTEGQLLQQAIQFVSNTVTNCGYTVCSTQRTHVQPNKITCCDCDTEDGTAYTVVGWVMRAYESDGRLVEVGAKDCPTLDATQMGFTVARCWPDGKTLQKTGDPRDTAAAELVEVLSCLRVAFARCEGQPAMFHNEPTEDDPNPPQQLCTRMLVGQFIADKDEDVTPYGDTGTVRRVCAGWSWSVTVA